MSYLGTGRIFKPPELSEVATPCSANACGTLLSITPVVHKGQFPSANAKTDPASFSAHMGPAVPTAFSKATKKIRKKRKVCISDEKFKYQIKSLCKIMLVL
jgi:hypothetical protein